MENSKRKELAKGVAVYAIGTFGTKLLSLLIVPLYTYYISTADMGVYDVLMGTASLLAPVITLQISDAAYKWILQEERIEDHIRATVQVLFLNCAIAFLLILLVSRFVTIPYYLYFAATMVLSRMLETLQKLLRGLKRQKLFSVSGIVYSAVFLSASAVIVCLEKTVAGLFIGAIAANLMTIIMILMAEKRLCVNPFARLDHGLIKRMLKFSIPLIPNYMNWWAMDSSDRYIVNFFLGYASNGILAVSHRFPAVLQTVLGAFNQSWQDVSIGEKQTNPEYYTAVFRRLYLFAIGLLFLAIPATKVFILSVMSADYKTSCNYVAFLYLGSVFQAFSSFYGVAYLKNNQTQKAFATSIIGAAVNAFSHLCMIRILGLQAAAISTFLGFLCMWLIREKQSGKELGISVEWKEFVPLISGAVIFAICSIHTDLPVNVALCGGGAMVFFFMNYSFAKTVCASALHRLHHKDEQ